MINNIVLVGRLTKDPDLRYTGNGTATANFTIAVNRNFTNQQGQREADFINCVIWRKSAENLANLCRKGVLLGVTGSIQTRNYENQQGQRVYVTEVVCNSFQKLEKDKQSEEVQQKNDYYSGNRNQNVQSQQSQYQASLPGVDPFNKEIDISDDDLPF